MAMISLCMIVKNEEENLANCLESVKKYVDEIVVVDTGSSDKTKQLALKYTDKVFDFEWCDDFSKARNFSIKKASNDWILILDADEFVVKFDTDKLIEELNINSNKVGRIEIVNKLQDEKKYIETVGRLFNKKFYHYEGIIHEQMVSIAKEIYKSWNTSIVLEHIGYTEKIINKTNKIERNINLLNNALKQNSEDPYTYYQLGKSFYMKKQYKTASDYFKTALNYVNDFRLEYVEDLIETYGYSMLNSGQTKNALKIGDYEKYYNLSADFNFLIGLISMNNALFDVAVSYFEKCLISKKGLVEGVNSFLPNYNIGVIYECLGKIDEACAYYSKCGDYKLAKNRINMIKKIK